MADENPSSLGTFDLPLESRNVAVGIAYCDQGFGPTHPWGLMFLTGPRSSMGMETSWHRSLEEAYIDMV